MSWKTQIGRRPDLEALEVNPVIGYIGNEVYPVITVGEKAGKIYYKTLTADAAAQTSRTAGTAPTRTLLTDSNLDFSCAEVIKSYGVAKSEVKQMGGIENADQLGGKASKRSVQRAQEDAQAAKLMSAARYAAALDVSSNPFDGILWKLDDVRRYSGRKALVFSERSFRAFINNTETKARLVYSFRDVPAADMLAKTPAVMAKMLAGFLAIDQVLIGDDNHWAISGREDAAAIVVLPPKEEFSHKMDPVLGKTIVYLPDGEQPYEIESYPLLDAKVNSYDCTGWYDIEEFNAAASVLVKVGNPAITTTTTA